VDPRLLQALQILLGVGCYVVAFTLFAKDLATYTLITGAGASLIGRTFVGPGQVSVTELQKLAPPSEPPAKPKP
jgi:hypothetical protein